MQLPPYMMRLERSSTQTRCLGMNPAGITSASLDCNHAHARTTKHCYLLMDPQCRFSFRGRQLLISTWATWLCWPPSLPHGHGLYKCHVHECPIHLDLFEEECKKNSGLPYVHRGIPSPAVCTCSAASDTGAVVFFTNI